MAHSNSSEDLPSGPSKKSRAKKNSAQKAAPANNTTVHHKPTLRHATRTVVHPESARTTQANLKAKSSTAPSEPAPNHSESRVDGFGSASLSDYLASTHAARPDFAPRTSNEPAPRAPSWIEQGIGFTKQLFNPTFEQSITLKVLPVLFGLSVLTLLLGQAYLTLIAFQESFFIGLITLLFLNPLLFIIGTALIRIVLEFCTSLSKVQLTMVEMSTGLDKVANKLDQLIFKMDGMDGNLTTMVGSLHDMQDNFKSVTRLAENLDGMTGKIPFIKKPKKEDRKNWAESSISDRFQYSTRSFYKIEE